MIKAGRIYRVKTSQFVYDDWMSKIKFSLSNDTVVTVLQVYGQYFPVIDILVDNKKYRLHFDKEEYFEKYFEEVICQ